VLAHSDNYSIRAHQKHAYLLVPFTVSLEHNHALTYLLKTCKSGYVKMQENKSFLQNLSSFCRIRYSNPPPSPPPPCAHMYSYAHTPAILWKLKVIDRNWGISNETWTILFWKKFDYNVSGEVYWAFFGSWL